MDTLVAHYSRPAYQEEGYNQEEQLELADVAPPLDLKFALPPTAQVLHVRWLVHDMVD